ncbi:hypothetical protein BOTBODRAFT_28224 [Botryobasidium botryosum FD-172 SS1]|uniref:Uncharacterized protein n=1 Tax=Botryobasidium botryosum (strain FD-172 SS1) TaxID=930990 RepID=A0A067MV78_BOTB1|nr:hypothetical protein BOTBODRAFT_28224 [Botryobasidium botryosum FD-172 SS1]
MSTAAPLTSEPNTNTDDHQTAAALRPNDTDAMGIKSTTGFPHSKNPELTDPQIAREVKVVRDNEIVDKTEEHERHHRHLLHLSHKQKQEQNAKRAAGHDHMDGAEGEHDGLDRDGVPFKEQVVGYAKVSRGTVLGPISAHQREQKEIGKKILANEIPATDALHTNAS